MEKIRKIFTDGEIIVYKFCQNKTISLLTKEDEITLNWKCIIQYNFGNLKKTYNIDNNNEIINQHKSYYFSKLKESYKLLNKFKKKKYKKTDEKQIIAALIYIIHDIKEEQRTKATIFYHEWKK